MSDNNNQKTLVNLLNPPFDFPFGDKVYQIKKASITQVQQYQTKLETLTKDTTTSTAFRDLEIASYVVFLVLNKADSTVTEEYVKDNMPGGIDILSLLAELGFIDPQKAELVKKLQQGLVSENSSRISQIEPAGLQPKSEI